MHCKWNEDELVDYDIVCYCRAAFALSSFISLLWALTDAKVLAAIVPDAATPGSPMPYGGEEEKQQSEKSVEYGLIDELVYMLCVRTHRER